MSVLYGDDGIRHRVSDSGAKVLLTDAANASRVEPSLVEHVLLLEDLPAGGDESFTPEVTLADDPAQLYYSSGTTGLAKGILHAHRYLLAHEEFTYCHDVQDGELFHGMGEWAWAAGIAPLLGPWRHGAVQLVFQREGGFDPERQLDVLSRHGATNVFTTPTAMRSMMGIADAGKRYPQKFRIVCSAGEPLNPEAIRWFREQYGLTVLDYYGLTESYPLVANYPFLDVREGSMGKPMPGWDVRILDEDERPVAVGERGEICLRARSNPHYPLGYWNNEEAGAETFGGDWFHTKDAARDRRGRLRLVRGPRRRRDHRRRLPHRPVRGRVRLPRARGGGRGGRGRLPRRAARQRGQGVHRLRRRRRGLGRARGRDQAVRARAPGRARVPAQDRVHRRPPEDADGQDPPDRAAPARAANVNQPKRGLAPFNLRIVEAKATEHRRPPALLPPSIARLGGFAALALLGALQWQRMVAGLSSGHALLWVLVAVAAAAAVLWADRLRRLRGPVTIAVIPLALLAAYASSGIALVLLKPRRIDELGAGLSHGAEALASVQMPYTGVDPWPSDTLQLLGALLCVAAALLAFWPRTQRTSSAGTGDAVAATRSSRSPCC